MIQGQLTRFDLFFRVPFPSTERAPIFQDLWIDRVAIGLIQAEPDADALAKQISHSFLHLHIDRKLLVSLPVAIVPPTLPGLPFVSPIAVGIDNEVTVELTSIIAPTERWAKFVDVIFSCRPRTMGVPQ